MQELNIRQFLEIIFTGVKLFPTQFSRSVGGIPISTAGACLVHSGKFLLKVYNFVYLWCILDLVYRNVVYYDCSKCP